MTSHPSGIRADAIVITSLPQDTADQVWSALTSPAPAPVPLAHRASHTFAQELCSDLHLCTASSLPPIHSVLQHSGPLALEIHAPHPPHRL
jgi:hypothetical protein